MAIEFNPDIKMASWVLKPPAPNTSLKRDAQTAANLSSLFPGLDFGGGSAATGSAAAGPSGSPATATQKGGPDLKKRKFEPVENVTVQDVHQLLKHARKVIQKAPDFSMSLLTQNGEMCISLLHAQAVYEM